MKILVVDDELNIRTGIRDGIDWTNIGIEEVIIASNGIEGLQIYKRANPEIVITDIKMPGMNGLELASEINKINNKTRIIVLSGYSDFEYARRAIKLKAVDYELKPIKIKRLIELVKNIKDDIFIENQSIQQKNEISNTTNKNLSMMKAKKYIDENYKKDITVEEMAEIIEKTPNYFSHLFKKEFNTSFSEYLNTIRIREAKRLMLESNMLIYEISDEVGFNDYKYFSYVFKKVQGCTPSEFMKGKY